MTNFEWNDANLEHVAKHGFTPEDAETAILDPKRVPSFAKQSSGRVDRLSDHDETRYGIIGEGTGGDILHVVFIIRSGKVRSRGK